MTEEEKIIERRAKQIAFVAMLIIIWVGFCAYWVLNMIVEIAKK